MDLGQTGVLTAAAGMDKPGVRFLSHVYSRRGGQLTHCAMHADVGIDCKLENVSKLGRSLKRKKMLSSGQ